MFSLKGVQGSRVPRTLFVRRLYNKVLLVLHHLIAADQPFPPPFDRVSFHGTFVDQK